MKKESHTPARGSGNEFGESLGGKKEVDVPFLPKERAVEEGKMFYRLMGSEKPIPREEREESGERGVGKNTANTTKKPSFSEFASSSMREICGPEQERKGQA